MCYYARSGNRRGEWQRAKEHARNVAQSAAKFLGSTGVADEARLAGLLHDLGKYSECFQRRLHGLEHGLDHWSPGAIAALHQSRSVAAAIAIQGHHIGLQQANFLALQQMTSDRLTSNHPLGLRLTESDTQLLLNRLSEDGIELPNLQSRLLNRAPETVADMLDIRMLYSALVDSDYLDAERDKEGRARPEGQMLEQERAFRVLMEHLQNLRDRSTASEAVCQMRNSLFDACVTAGSEDERLWTLTAPTGAGKTLSMLAFALAYAIRHGLRRIVVVIPYLSIIEQTVQIYNSIFSSFGDGYVLEHHSLAEHDTVQSVGEAADADTPGPRRLLSENWDAPLVVTTSVQLLESLFANRPAACRKLHRLASSVILFDEVQTIPAPLAPATLAALSWLSRKYASTVVFSTATQPAFNHLDQQVSNLNGGVCGWSPREVVPDCSHLFAFARRTQVTWPLPDQRNSWGEIASEMLCLSQVCCIVNLKRHAQDLLDALGEVGATGLFHLSTSMCPAHRRNRLSEINDHLRSGDEVKLVSTSCIEAGVDLDCPAMLRAFADVVAIAQAAGRCNRNDLLDVGMVRVFLPEEEAYPSPAYRQAADITMSILREMGPDALDINDPATFERYYRRLYDLAQPQNCPRASELYQAIRSGHFPEVGRLYQVIDQSTINVLVPYDLAAWESLVEDARRNGLSGGWIRRARAHTISLYRPADNAPVHQYLEPVMLRNGDPSGDWFVYLEPGHYTDLAGLQVPQGAALWIG